MPARTTEVVMRGRKPPGPEVVHRLDGSDESKHRLEVILRTLTGALHVTEAARLLQVSPQWVDTLRTRAMAGALAGLEEKTRGRPRKAPPLDPEVAALQGEIARLRQELTAAKLREEIAALAGHGRLEKKRGSAAAGADRRGGRQRGSG